MFESMASPNLFLVPSGAGFYQRYSSFFFHDSVMAGEDHFGGEREAKRKGSLSFQCCVGSLVYWSNK